MQRRRRKGIRFAAIDEPALPARAGRALQDVVGLPARSEPYQPVETPPPRILEVARAVRHVLLQAFPERRKLELQCQRSSAMIAAVLRKERIEVHLISGRILGDRKDPQGNTDHIWCRVVHPEGGGWYLLDVALTQFDHLYDHPVPQIVWGKYWSTLRRYGYREDNPPEWQYDPRAVDPQRVQAVRSLVG